MRCGCTPSCLLTCAQAPPGALHAHAFSCLVGACLALVSGATPPSLLGSRPPCSQRPFEAQYAGGVLACPGGVGMPWCAGLPSAVACCLPFWLSVIAFLSGGACAGASPCPSSLWSGSPVSSAPLRLIMLGGLRAFPGGGGALARPCHAVLRHTTCFEVEHLLGALPNYHPLALGSCV